MANLPPQLRDRLGPDEAAILDDAMDAIGEELAAVYRTNVADHKESRGDNAVLFGMKVWVHCGFRVAGRFDDDAAVQVVHPNGSFAVQVAGLTFGIYKLGDGSEEDVHVCFPDTSPTKRSYADRNVAQLKLFDADPDSLLPPSARFALNDLIIGHFGNPRDGLVKWYVGAPTTDAIGFRRWAWITKQEQPAATTASDTAPPPMVPYDAREVEEITVRPRSGRQAS